MESPHLILVTLPADMIAVFPLSEQHLFPSPTTEMKTMRKRNLMKSPTLAIIAISDILLPNKSMSG